VLKSFVSVNCAGGKNIAKRGGAIVRGKNVVTIGSSNGMTVKREKRRSLVEDAKVSAENRPTDRELSKALGRSMQTIRHDRTRLQQPSD
jgi:hypothetical protein